MPRADCRWPQRLRELHCVVPGTCRIRFQSSEQLPSIPPRKPLRRLIGAHLFPRAQKPIVLPWKEWERTTPLCASPVIRYEFPKHGLDMTEQSVSRPTPGEAGSFYSRMWMLCFAEISFSCLGQTDTVTSPRCAVRSRYMKVRDCPMPPPIESGIWSFMMAW